VGRWAGHDLRKLGEGLCSSRTNPTTRLAAIVLGSDGLFVGGAFSTLVWNGTAFATVQAVRASRDACCPPFKRGQAKRETGHPK
jgi:hypothetical protein